MSNTETISLKQYLFAIKRRWLPAVTVFALTIGLTALYISWTKPIYQALGKLILSNSKSPSLTGLTDQVGNLSSLSSQGSPLDTAAEEMRSEPLLMRTIAALNLRDRQGNPQPPEAFSSGLQVKNVFGTDVLEISYSSHVPEEAASAVNALMNFYVSSNITTNRAEATAARQALEKRLPELEKKVKLAEQSLRQFEETNNVASLPEQAKTGLETVAEIDRQIAQTRSQLAKANTSFTALQQQVGLNLPQAKATNSLSQSPAVQTALRQYQEAQSQLAIARTRYQEANPVVIDLKEKVASLRSILQQRAADIVNKQIQQPRNRFQTGDLEQRLTENFVNLKVESLGLSSQLAALINQRQVYQQKVNVIPKLRDIQRRLERELKVAQLNYETLLQQLPEARLAENQNLGNARIIQAARVPSQPIAPRKMQLFGIGGLIGGFLAISTVLILEAFDKSIKTVREARRTYDFTVLGIIPSLTQSQKNKNTLPEEQIPELLARNYPCSPLCEAYRMLHANLKFLSTDRPLKVIAIASALPREGKSAVSANLATAIAQLGHRVLLIDADLRCPRQHQIWELSNAVGLSNVLVSQASINDAIQTAIENLDILTSGVVPPNPIALLDSNKMTNLVREFSQRYNYVIIDTPALALASDALILGKIADGLLMIARPRFIDFDSANSVKESLMKSNQNVLGLVINGVVPENEPDSYYYYYTKGYSNSNQNSSLSQTNSV